MIVQRRVVGILLVCQFLFVFYSSSYFSFAVLCLLFNPFPYTVLHFEYRRSPLPAHFLLFVSRVFVILSSYKLPYPVLIYALSTLKTFLWLRTDVSDFIHNFLTNAERMGTSVNLSGGTGGEPRYPPLYIVEEDVYLHASKLDSHWFAIMPLGKSRTMRVGYEEAELPFPC